MSQPVHASLDAAFLDTAFLSTEFLEDLADSLGHAVADNGGAVLVHVVARPDGPDIGMLPLDGLAPANVLLGAMAPAHWAVLGVATGGWARSLDRRAGRVRAEVVVLVVRDGRVVGRVRQGDQVITEPPASGVTLDCLQRALGLPTAPPGETSVDWVRLRETAIEGGWPALGLTPEEATWLDVGAFSRWVLSQRPADAGQFSAHLRQGSRPPVLVQHLDDSDWDQEVVPVPDVLIRTCLSTWSLPSRPMPSASASPETTLCGYNLSV